MSRTPLISSFFFFNDTATTEIYTLSLHDALPILEVVEQHELAGQAVLVRGHVLAEQAQARVAVPLFHVAEDLVVAAVLLDEDRKSTRLNSSHGYISYAVFCLKKKKKNSNTKALRL